MSDLAFVKLEISSPPFALATGFNFYSIDTIPIPSNKNKIDKEFSKKQNI
jgi:hypothetical protein